MHPDHRDSRLLNAGHFAGIKFDDGWWFIQVVGTEYQEVKPWFLLNENEARAELAADGTAGVDTDEIRDPQQRKILEPNDEDRNTVFQILYGIAPSRMQVFRLFGRDRNEAVENYDQPGDPAAYINGFDSPYDNPSLHSEVFYVNEMSPLRLQAYNPMDEAAAAKLSFHVNKLRYTTVTDKNLMKAMLQGQQPARLHMLGEGIQNSQQNGIPNWVEEAFGEHIFTTSEILDAEGQNGGGPLSSERTDLERLSTQ